ncbi:DUF6139 family protein [Ramlibacter sp. MAHUQ-53]|uniref:DUF6139 family protein n=1 Tax=unclassified Ramlibacter TaxID=2617605 RepID=UPI00363D8CAE
MQLDIYCRPEAGQRVSYLAVPAGRPIPPEATSTEWQQQARARELDEDAPAFEEYGIDAPGPQLREKGYAITGLARQPRMPAEAQGQA